MKRVFQFCFSMVFFAFGFSQGLKPIAQKVKNAQTARQTFVKYDLFTSEQSAQRVAQYRAAAEDITVMKLNKSEVKRITSEKPAALEMSFPFEGKNITVELVKNDIFANGFTVNTDKGKVAYTPGVYYYGIVKGDNKSVVAFSFFENEVMGVASQLSIGNIVLGKAKNSEDYVSYNEDKLKESNPFVCGTDDLVENHGAGTNYDPEMLTRNTTMTANCVRVYYEVGYNLYTLQGNNTTTVTNWVTAMFNNVKTLYNNDNISIAMSEMFIWTSADPYPTPNNSNGATVLASFRSGRPTFNGDVGQLLKSPAVTSVAYVDTLCTTSNHSFCGMNLSYQNVPTYSWNIMVMAHEMGHNLSSPHTHDCRWNGNNTRIDGCGPASGNPGNGTCDSGPLPTGTGGTIMSYCHLIGSVGTNLANGFGPQPAAMIRSTVERSACLGTDCIASCTQTATNLTISNLTNTSATATIVDNTGTSWRYTLTKYGQVIDTGVTTNKILNFNNLQPGSIYFVTVGADCTGPEAYAARQMIFTDADWCTGVLFTDTGGPSGNYSDSENWTKTFYPTNPNDKLKITFSEFDTEPSSDYMIAYNGPNIASPRFTTTTISGDAIPGPFTSTHATGAITIRFISNSTTNKAGWKATFECLTLGTGENALSGGVVIAQTTVKGVYSITSKEKILSVEVFDMSGKLIRNLSKVNSTEENLNLSAYPAGTYVVSVTTAKEKVNKKVVR